MEIIKNQTVLDWINAQVDLTKPDQVVWIDGSEAQLEALRQQACSTGAGPSSAVSVRRTPAPPTTGWLRRRCTRSSTSSTTGP